jgi:hypothetical protein
MKLKSYNFINNLHCILPLYLIIEIIFKIFIP